MSELICVLPTTWTHIRFALYRRADSYYQFAEQHLLRDEQPDLAEFMGGEPDPAEKEWVSLIPSGIYSAAAVAREDMLLELESCESS